VYRLSIAYLDSPYASEGAPLAYDACLTNAEKPSLATYAEGGGDAVRVRASIKELLYFALYLSIRHALSFLPPIFSQVAVKNLLSDIVVPAIDGTAVRGPASRPVVVLPLQTRVLGVARAESSWMPRKAVLTLSFDVQVRFCPVVVVATAQSPPLKLC
jgi:hypothetical protein